MKNSINYISIAFIIVSSMLWVFLVIPWYVPILFITLRAIFLLVVSVVPKWNYFLNATHQLHNQSQKDLYLTFDDGPTAFTSEILDMLKANQAKATFFCIGKQIEKYPEIFERILTEGHTVGNHSYSHSYFIGFFGKKRLMRELELCNLIAQNISNANLKLYRPPFGVITPVLNRVIKKFDYKVVCWSKRSLDTLISNPKTILKRITSNIKSGDIILLHDTSSTCITVLTEILKKEDLKTFDFKAINNDYERLV